LSLKSQTKQFVPKLHVLIAKIKSETVNRNKRDNTIFGNFHHPVSYLNVRKGCLLNSAV